MLSATIREYCFIPASSLQVTVSFDAYETQPKFERFTPINAKKIHPNWGGSFFGGDEGIRTLVRLPAN